MYATHRFQHFIITSLLTTVSTAYCTVAGTSNTEQQHHQLPKWHYLLIRRWLEDSWSKGADARIAMCAHSTGKKLHAPLVIRDTIPNCCLQAQLDSNSYTTKSSTKVGSFSVNLLGWVCIQVSVCWSPEGHLSLELHASTSLLCNTELFTCTCTTTATFHLVHFIRSAHESGGSTTYISRRTQPTNPLSLPLSISSKFIKFNATYTNKSMKGMWLGHSYIHVCWHKISTLQKNIVRNSEFTVS